MTEKQSLTNPNLHSANSSARIEVALALILRDPPHAPGSTPDIRLGSTPQNIPRPAEVLVTQRPVGTICAGAWEFPGGKVEPGESSDQAAAREALEEVGLIVTPRRRLPEVAHTYPHGTVRLDPWICHLDPPGQTPAARAVADWHWVTLDQIAELDFLAGNAAILAHLAEALGAGDQP